MTKTFLVLAAGGFLAACAAVIPANIEAMPGAGVAGGQVATALISNTALAGKLDIASRSGALVTYAYFTDVVGEVTVLGAADAYCGGNGKATLNVAGAGLDRGQKDGRGYNIMTFACRA